jgi:hypothetical protein
LITALLSDLTPLFRRVPDLGGNQLFDHHRQILRQPLSPGQTAFATFLLATTLSGVLLRFVVLGAGFRLSRFLESGKLGMLELLALAPEKLSLEPVDLLLLDRDFPAQLLIDPAQLFGGFHRHRSVAAIS